MSFFRLRCFARAESAEVPEDIDDSVGDYDDVAAF